MFFHPEIVALEDWNLFFSSLIWLSTGWDSFGNLAEEVQGPKQLLRGLLWAALADFLVAWLGCRKKRVKVWFNTLRPPLEIILGVNQ